MSNRKRYLSLAKNIAASFGLRGINLVSTAFIVPICLTGLGPHDYAIFTAVLSASILLTYGDLGLGFSLVERLSGISHNSKSESNSTINRFVIGLCAISSALLVFGIFSLFFATYFISNVNASTLFALLACITLNIPAGLGPRILFATERNLTAAAWNATSRILSVLLVIICNLNGLPLYIYIISVLMPQVIVNYAVLYTLLDFKSLLLAFSQFKETLLGFGSDISLGLRYCLTQLASYVDVAADILILSALSTAVIVVNYDISSRLFNYIPALISLACLPVWPAISRAVADGDDIWARKIAGYVNTISSFVCASAAGFIAAFHPSIVRLWVGTNVGLGMPELIPMAVCFGALGVLQAQSMVTAARGGIAKLAKLQIISLPITLFVKLAVVSVFGVAAMLWVFSLTLAVRVYLGARIIKAIHS